jgi:hypothetical protein
VREWVRQEYLLPSLVIGLDEDRFWKQTPKTIQIYFEADKIRQQRQVQEAWLVGAYVKQALSSTILVAGLADKNTASKLPKYPKCPYESEQEKVLTDEQKEYEKLRLVQYLNNFSHK